MKRQLRSVEAIAIQRTRQSHKQFGQDFGFVI